MKRMKTFLSLLLVLSLVVSSVPATALAAAEGEAAAPAAAVETLEEEPVSAGEETVREEMAAEADPAPAPEALSAEPEEAAPEAVPAEPEEMVPDAASGPEAGPPAEETPAETLPGEEAQLPPLPEDFEGLPHGAEMTPLSDTPVSGTVYASALEDNCDLILTGNTTLQMDVEKTLHSITGPYKLTILGSCKLTVDNPAQGDAISIGSLVSAVSLEVNAPSGDGICVDGSISLNGGEELTVNSRGRCLYAKDSFTARNMSVSLHSSMEYGIYTKDLTITGAERVSVISSEIAIHASETIEISAGTVYVSSHNQSGFSLGSSNSGDSLKVTAQTLSVIAERHPISASHGTITLNVSGEGTLRSTYIGQEETYGFGIDTRDDIYLGGGGTLEINTPYGCIYTRGNLNVTNLSLDFWSRMYYGILASEIRITDTESVYIRAHEDGIIAWDKMDISAGSVTVTSSKDSGITLGSSNRGKSMKVSAETLTVTAERHPVAASKGTVTLNVSGEGTLRSTYIGSEETYGFGIHAHESVTFGGSGSLSIYSRFGGIYAGSVTSTIRSLSLSSTLYYGIHAGSVKVTDAEYFYVSAKDTCVQAAEKITISADLVTISSTVGDGLCVFSNEGESLSVTADTLTIWTGHDPIYSTGDVILNVSGEASLKSYFTGMDETLGFGIRAHDDITVGGGGTLEIHSLRDCILCSSGTFTATDVSIDLHSLQSNGVTAKVMTITGGDSLEVSSRLTGLSASKKITVSARTVTVRSTEESGISVNGSDGESLRVTANLLSLIVGARPLFSAGSMMLYLGVMGELESTGGEGAAYADDGITLEGTLPIWFPEGGRVGSDGETFVDASGQDTSRVLFGYELSGTVSIEGTSAEFASNGEISFLCTGMPLDAVYTWQISDDGINWTALEAAAAYTYPDGLVRVTRCASLSESDRYFRVYATSPSQFGEIYSPAAHVKKAYKVRYYPSGGSGTMDDVGAWKNAGDTFTLSENRFTPPERKSFAAWQIDGVLYQPGETITIAGETSIYAVWEYSACLLRFSPGDGTGAMESVTVPIGQSCTVPACTFTPPAGKVFSRWAVTGGIYYAPGDTVTVTSNILFVAEWRSDEIVVSFDPNGGTGSINPVRLTPAQAAAYTLPACTYNPPVDCMFEAWQIIDSGSSLTVYGQPGDVVSLNGPYVTLKALWASKPYYTVTFNANGHGTAPAPQSVMQDKYAEDPGVLYADGYSFLGWYTNAAGTNRFNFAATKITGPITLYAKWIEGITSLAIHGFQFPEAGKTSVSSRVITTGNKAYVCTGIQWRWPSTAGSYGYAVSYDPFTFAPSIAYTAVITLETADDAVFDTSVTLDSVTINGETVNVDLSKSGFVSDTKYQLFTVPVTTEDAIPIDADHFPDAAFRAELGRWYFDTNQDGYLTPAEIANMTDLSVPNKGITSLEGIGCLSSLKTLNATGNALTALDLSSNWYLEEIYCSGNTNLEELILPRGNRPKKLQCYNCALTGLDLRGITYLAYAADETPEISGTKGTYSYYVNGELKAQIITDTDVALYSSYISHARVSFDPGLGSGSMPYVMASKSQYYTLPANGFTAPDGMYFIGWRKGGTNELYEAGKTMDEYFAADENEVTFIALWKSAAVLTITPPDATRTLTLGGFSVNYTYTGTETLTTGKWLTAAEGGSAATVLNPNSTYYALILFPQDTMPAARLTSLIDQGKFVIKNAEYVDVTTSTSGSHYRTGLIVSVRPRTLTVFFNSGGGGGVMRPETGLYPGSLYEFPICGYAAPADRVFNGWDLGAAGTKITLNSDLTLIARWTLEDGAVPVTEEFFPDEDFRNYVSNCFDTNGGGYLISSEIRNAEGISDSTNDFTSVEGIQYLTELTSLLIDESDSLTRADLRSNTKLSYVDFSGDESLAEIKLDGLDELTWLYVNGTALTELDLTGKAELKSLACCDASITELDISDCPLLLDAYFNGTRTEYQTWVQYESGGNLLSVDLSTEVITSKGIPVDEAHFPDQVFRSLVSTCFDLNGNGYLNDREIEAVEVISGVFSEADIADLTGVGYFTELESLDVSGNELTQLDLSANQKLTHADVSGNAIASLDLTGLALLEELDCSDNALTDLDVSGLQLTELRCERNLLRSLVLGDQPYLTLLHCYGTGGDGTGEVLSELDILGSPYLLDAVLNGQKTTPDWGDRYDGPLGGELFVDAGTKIVGQPAGITGQPQDVTVRITDTAEFTVTAEGEGLSYQWQESADGGETWSDLESGTKAALQVTAAEDNNGYRYRCVVTNRYGISGVSDAAALTVNGGKCGETAYWVLEDGVLTVFGEGQMASYSLTGAAPWYGVREQITSVVIENGITKVGTWAFCFCTNLTEVEIPDSVTAIGGYAFRKCSSLEEVFLPDSVALIDGWAFYDDTSLAAVNIPSGVKTLTSRVFGNCTSLTEITVPSGVTTVQTQAFSNCTALTVIRFEDSAPAIGNNAFENVTATAFYPGGDASWTESVRQDYGGTITWAAIAPTSGMCGENAYWEILYDVLFIYGTGDMTSFASAEEVPWILSLGRITSVEIDEGITGIGSHAFRYCSAMDSVTIPNTVTAIGDGAFAGSGLTEITFAGSAPTFGSSVFEDVAATAYYPAADTTWKAGVLQNYGGSITWVAYLTNDEIEVDFSHSCSFGNDLSINYYIDAAQIPEGAVIKLLVEKDVWNAAGTEKTIRTYEISDYTTGTSQGVTEHKFTFSGIAAKEMGDEVRVRLSVETYVGREPATVLTDWDVYSVAEYAYNRLMNSEKVNFRKLLVDMLNYGAAAQINFNYRTNALANAELTEAQQAMGTQADVTDEGVAESFITPLSGTPQVTFTGKAAVFGNSVELKYYFELAEGVEPGDVSLRLIYTAVDGSVKTVTLSSAGAIYNAADKEYALSFAGIAAKDMGQPVEAQFVDAAGQAVSDTLYYSIENYCFNRLAASTNARFKALIRAALKYGRAAKAYFENPN